MKALKNLALVLFTVSIIFACSDSKEDLPISLEELIVQGKPIDVSALAKEQQKSRKKLAVIIATNLKVDGDKVAFMIGRDKFVFEGFSESLYDMLIKDIDAMNVNLSQQPEEIRQGFLQEFPAKMEKLRTQAEQLVAN